MKVHLYVETMELLVLSLCSSSNS